MRRRLRAALGLGVAAAVGAAGCGGSRPAATGPSPCSTAARGLIAGAAATSPAGVGTSTVAATTGAPTCRFVAPRGAGGPIVVLVGLDGAPQAAARLERQAVEYSQTVLWGHLGSGAYPQTVARLGVEAYWFPADRRLLTTDGARLIEVTVTWPGASRPRARTLAERLARAYLGYGHLTGRRPRPPTVDRGWPPQLDDRPNATTRATHIWTSGRKRRASAVVELRTCKACESGSP